MPLYATEGNPSREGRAYMGVSHAPTPKGGIFIALANYTSTV